jgi:hypothetical protein
LVNRHAHPQISLDFIYNPVVIYAADCDNRFELSAKTGIVALPKAEIA